MRVVFGILLFPIAWLAIFLYRMIFLELIWGLICWFTRILNPLRFIAFFVFWMFCIVVDIFYSAYKASIGAVSFSGDIICKNEYKYNEMFENQHKLYKKTDE